MVTLAIGYKVRVWVVTAHISRLTLNVYPLPDLHSKVFEFFLSQFHDITSMKEKVILDNPVSGKVSSLKPQLNCDIIILQHTLIKEY